MFRSLQSQPRIITLFCGDMSRNRTATNILNYLRDKQNGKVIDVEVHDQFPTRDQLQYMYRTDSKLLSHEVNGLGNLLKTAPPQPPFGQSLADAATAGVWNNGALWVDWEKQKMGNTLRSIESHLK
ncbi:similar to Saccharomyces cerevisiae YKR049C FMP46 Putative redox protein containing a thioredoxin fold [Maudiozyma barnettii]|mgnify:CR=1 FL=1|uniref:Similar to Saccharomyces cerevisiae YKR049C FMP46 Putative redox protein containing a thioredoxin fold n=1 Tax=Maudiozyma barnettii TaxID=61262 RepID=A0A8H2VFG9_9SACH|nr:uncharacterized protein KABA2_04S09966 [Kazachstania barnettii]CAB4254600.1 similar to Saccharomyces cerevisiae YKR049C FMP46 Putative redox protein containing a thioredoxin fold [Kazachstania barnettii]CAD1782642.1 similar to Saccharomyces cerevisiae YKR049C FMP46 Putative redox protein containing a thioredoxin fold [Kazachstania barnettii]